MLLYFHNIPHNKDFEFSHLCKKAEVLVLIPGVRRKHPITAITIIHVVMHEKKLLLLSNTALKHLTSKSPFRNFEKQ